MGDNNAEVRKWEAMQQYHLNVLHDNYESEISEKMHQLSISDEEISSLENSGEPIKTGYFFYKATISTDERMKSKMKKKSIVRRPGVPKKSQEEARYCSICKMKFENTTLFVVHAFNVHLDDTSSDEQYADGNEWCNDLNRDDGSDESLSDEY